MGTMNRKNKYAQYELGSQRTSWVLSVIYGGFPVLKDFLKQVSLFR